MIDLADVSLELEIKTSKDKTLKIEVLTVFDLAQPPVVKEDGETYTNHELKLMGIWANESLDNLILDSEDKDELIAHVSKYSLSTYVLTAIFDELNKKKPILENK